MTICKKMKVMYDLMSDTFESAARKLIAHGVTAVMDNLTSHSGVEKAVTLNFRVEKR